jgi:hypothetical protein
MSYECPVRGQVTQRVVVKRYKPQDKPTPTTIDPLVSDLLRELEESGFHEDVD